MKIFLFIFGVIIFTYLVFIHKKTKNDLENLVPLQRGENIGNVTVYYYSNGGGG